MTEKIIPDIAASIEAQLKENDENKSAELHWLISRHFSAKMSPPTLRKYIHNKLEWAAVRTRIRPMISERKKEELARACLDKKDTFDNVIWSDKSSIQLTVMPKPWGSRLETSVFSRCMFGLPHFWSDDGRSTICEHPKGVPSALPDEKLSWRSLLDYARQWPKTYSLCGQRLLCWQKGLIGGQHLQVVQTSTPLSGYGRSLSILLLELANHFKQKIRIMFYHQNCYRSVRNSTKEK